MFTPFTHRVDAYIKLGSDLLEGVTLLSFGDDELAILLAILLWATWAAFTRRGFFRRFR